MKMLVLDIIIGAVALLLAFGAFLFWMRRRQPRALKATYFQAKWKEIQSQLSDKKNWSTSIINADKLLDEALKKKRFKGKAPGERLVAAQRLFTDNDGVWFSHKLRTKIDAEPTTKLKKTDVQKALMSIRQALKDLGALPDGQPRDTK